MQSAAWTGFAVALAIACEGSGGSARPVKTEPDAGSPTAPAPDASAPPIPIPAEVPGAPADPAAFRVLEIPSLDGFSTPVPFGIDNRGDVVGVYRSSYDAPSRAFLYDGETGVVRRIMDDGSVSRAQAAYGINDARQVAGVVNDGISFQGVRWEHDVTTHLPSLTVLDGYSLAGAINRAGQVAGVAAISLHDERAVLWDGTIARQLGETGARAFGMNDDGVVVGIGDGPRAVVFAGGRAIELQALGPGGAGALGVSALGRVVGRTWIPDGRVHAFVYDLPDGPMKDVSPGATYCDLYSVNVRGVAVGACDDRAVILRGERTEFLDDVFGTSGWSFHTARAIDDRGDIAGEALHDGRASAYVIRVR